MHVTSPCREQRDSRSRTFAAVLMLALAGTGGLAQAAGFDEKLKAPMMKDAADLRTQIESFAPRYREIRAATPMQMITNASLARQQFDLTWQLERAVNDGRPLKEIEAIGFVNHGDGSYSIDVAVHPEWRVQANHIKSGLTSSLLEPICGALVERGFRPEDVAALKNYVSVHDVVAMGRAATASTALAFHRVVQKFDKARRPVPDSLVISYWYQNTRLINETNRAWTEGLLENLDAQRRRILLSYFSEAPGSFFLIPEGVSAGIGQTLTSVRAPDFEQRVMAIARGEAL